MSVTIVLLLLAIMLVVGMPVALAMGVSGAVGLYMFGGWPILAGILKTTPLSTANDYEIITIPMFILMAEFVLISGVANDLFRAATIWVGRLRGGVAMATEPPFRKLSIATRSAALRTPARAESGATGTNVHVQLRSMEAADRGE